MHKITAARTSVSACLIGLTLPLMLTAADAPSWNRKAAAGALDERQAWWANFPSAQRDHDTFCVSCHTTLPYALARPRLRASVGERQASSTEATLEENVLKRVRQWNEIAPYYPDQTAGVPRTSQSRGTESVLNAAVLAARDASAGTLSADTRTAFANMWALQMKTGELSGAWVWLHFRLEPWESDQAPYWRVNRGGRHRHGAGRLRVHAGHSGRSGRAPRLPWQAVRSPALLQSIDGPVGRGEIARHVDRGQIRAAVNSRVPLQQTDGGWSMSALGPWKRSDGSEQDKTSDGYATGLATLALQETGFGTDPRVMKALEWLAANQDRRRDAGPRPPSTSSGIP